MFVIQGLNVISILLPAIARPCGLGSSRTAITLPQPSLTCNRLQDFSKTSNHSADTHRLSVVIEVLVLALVLALVAGCSTEAFSRFSMSENLSLEEQKWRGVGRSSMAPMRRSGNPNAGNNSVDLYTKNDSNGLYGSVPGPNQLTGRNHLASPVELNSGVDLVATEALKPAQLLENTATTLQQPVATQAESTVTLQVTSLPVAEILSVLALEIGADLLISAPEMMSRKSNAVTLHSKKRTVSQLLNLLAVQAGFAWELKNSVLHVFDDVPYFKTYPVEYLNIKRSTESSVGLATQVGSINLNPDSASNPSGHSNNSRTQIDNTVVHDFWHQLQSDLAKLIDAGIDDSSAIANSENVLVNREAGLVTIRGLQAQHLQIEKYLRGVLASVNRQVLIEATVVEVNLSDKHRSGIDWSIISDGHGLNWSQQLHGLQAPSATGGRVSQPTPSALLGFSGKDDTLGSISATLDLLDEFGDIQILSKPRIMVLNNQSAVLKVVDNRVYFSVNVERQNIDEREDVITQTRIHTVPVGLVMNVIPFIGANDRIVLNIRPTISRILGFVNDPNPELGSTNINNGVPEIQVREMESILRLKSGQVAVIGGLMQATQSSGSTGVPYLSDVPLLGGLFSRRHNSTGKSELLVFLKPTILSNSIESATTEFN